ncbi:phosphatidylinositide phosphatase SAC1-like protein [Blastocystis sp. ATCC 50177/Nand II]|uniref:Phosphatidylinositide phosphatase SAC1-like protein n=1 Tax=Blastocystis sp. subtype 1 (strain ATCC 50177 / NandII) TaxID=478820 RepID=A0A196SAD0_BLAHN|nr:phosphatidylinositide phosphatase SAC1-like protein [Blastocystis sp. ATCC 50177/Nand II]
MAPFLVLLQPDCILIREKKIGQHYISLSNDHEKLHIEKVESASVHTTHSFESAGILGVYELSHALFVAFITQSEVIGFGVTDNPIYKISDVRFVMVPPSRDSVVNTKYISMIQEAYRSMSMYYSYTDDLTCRLQDSKCKPLTEEQHQFPTPTKPHFMFNQPLIQAFVPFKSMLFPDLIPIVIFGFIKIIPSITIRKLSFSLTLISRRSIYRNGRRFNTRGADAKGHVANFVESEQIIRQDTGLVASFVQIRGSIPLEWRQTPTLKYTPKIAVAKNPETLSRHFDALVREYGRVTVVNLIDKKKDQLMIGEAFERGCMEYNKAQNNVDFFWFDFHAECKKMHYENLEKLMSLTEQCFQNGGSFAMNLKTRQLLGLQTAVLRTNCIDCLDRTNVVQSLYAKHMLFSQLFGDDGEAVLAECFDGPVKHEIFTVFNGLWSDNADQMSLLYSSSRSLKTDFTRTGKRTTRGAIDDGVNSVIRYFNNNFCDGYFEDCLNLAFARVEMGEAADRRVVKEKKCTFGSFLCVVVLPVILLFFGISYVLFPHHRRFAFSTLSSLYLGIIGYLFVEKGTSFGRTFVSRAMLPLKE